MKFRYALPLLSALLLAYAAPAFAASVVISEFRTRGPAGGNDEFVEIFNASASAVNIGGWQLNGSNNSGTTSTRATVPGGITLNPGCYYLFTNSGAYSGVVPGDQTYGTGITDTGGIALVDATLTIVDQVGMSGTSAYLEGTPLAAMLVSQEQSYERLPGGGSGNGTDTDDNATDFFLNTGTSNPNNSSSGCIAPTATSGSTWGMIKTMYR